MSANFTDYRVVSVLNNRIQVSLYCVEDKNTGRLYVWEAVDYGLLTANGKTLLMADIHKLLGFSHQHLIQSVNCVDHRIAGTLYIVKEYCNGSLSALIKKCKSTNSFIDENFIWKTIYQLARATQALYSRGVASIHPDLTTLGVHLDGEGNVKLDYCVTFREIEAERRSNRGMENTNSRDGSERCHKKNDTFLLGSLINGLATLQHENKKLHKLPPHYSEELQSIIDLMLADDADKRPTIEGILYHPLLMSQVVTTSFQQISLKQETNQSVCLKCKELQEKLTVFKKQEAAARAKELELKAREKNLAQREKHICILERLTKEKLGKAEVFLENMRRDRALPPNDLDSSTCSADPGDTNSIPTIAKLDPSRIIRPPSLAPSVSSKRSVRFETIPEKPENESQVWLRNKRNRFRANHDHDKVLRKRGKENQDPMKKNSSSVISLPHSTKETHEGLLETFFR